MMYETKILVFGSLNIDKTFTVDHIVRPGETISSGSLLKSAGGKGANQAAALAKAGAPVYMAGKIGEDGRFLLSLLESYGVNTRHVVMYEGETGQAVIQLDKKSQNSIVLFGGGNVNITIDEINQALAEFAAGDLIVLQNEIVHTRQIMEAAKKRGLRICLNPSPYDETIESLPLELADILFVNEIEGAALAGVEPGSPPPKALDNLTRRFPRAEIILTAGKDGAYYGCGELREKSEIVDAPVVDTTGAGDAFTGYFLAARHTGRTVAEALAAASKAASIAVSRTGAMEAVPFAREVLA
ncbi:MAG: PfkB family carbohydrate kinase [Spirochaetaceae bacterium]|jgi:ribokinase|nr:PfkB family carbohydrate kinase [Spirochaetaceae bacterium]